MASYFFDSSAIAKRYLTELGSAWVRTIANPAAMHDIYLVRVTPVEVVSALVRQSPPLPAVDLARNLIDFRHDYQNQYQMVAVNEAVVDRAMTLAETHRLRGYDAVQLAAALELLAVGASAGLPQLNFISADNQLNAAAGAEGLKVDNPTTHP